MIKIFIYLLIFVLILTILLSLFQIKTERVGDKNLINELVVINDSDISIGVMVDVVGNQTYLGFLRYKTSATEGFGPSFSMPGRASVYWCLAEQGPKYFYNKADFDLREIKIPNDICKTKFIYKGDGVWRLELYSNSNKEKAFIELTANSLKLDPPFKVPPR